MSVSIDASCITCGACEWECPDEAISPGSVRPMVNSSRCTECFGSFGESQCMVVCPVKAIHVSTFETTEVLSGRFVSLHPGRSLQDTWIWRRIESTPR